MFNLAERFPSAERFSSDAFLVMPNLDSKLPTEHFFINMFDYD
jgi:hypothetical protein